MTREAEEFRRKFRFFRCGCSRQVFYNLTTESEARYIWADIICNRHMMERLDEPNQDVFSATVLPSRVDIHDGPSRP